MNDDRGTERRKEGKKEGKRGIERNDGKKERKKARRERERERDAAEGARSDAADADGGTCRGVTLGGGASARAGKELPGKSIRLTADTGLLAFRRNWQSHFEMGHARARRGGSDEND